ncbi:MAG: plasmid mobilization relaxosome protein MobC [Alphaproteobacteria bacterium]|nr:plasmid mobilization relaxosome protein MobC [Alphaproteobacteria bacterium]MCL2505996.1 plasmid mobilization relaxosome protein MobC [Alphaproteobacteria bacterium]
MSKYDVLTSIHKQFKQAAKEQCEYKYSTGNVLQNDIKNVGQKDAENVKQNSKSSAQVESCVKRDAVLHNSCGLKPDKKRTVHLGIRLSTIERNILAGHAERNSLTISQYARLVLLKSPALDPHRHRLLLRGLYYLNKQGANLNQIAKRLNTYPVSAESAKAVIEIQQGCSEIYGTICNALTEGRHGSWLTE